MCAILSAPRNGVSSKKSQGPPEGTSESLAMRSYDSSRNGRGKIECRHSGNHFRRKQSIVPRFQLAHSAQKFVRKMKNLTNSAILI